MSEYVGPDSCAAKKRGWYIAKKPTQLSYYAALIWASYKDFVSGYKYDDQEKCSKRRCDATCFTKKLIFIEKLVSWHSPRHQMKVKKWIDYVLRYKRLPREVKQLYTNAIIYIRHGAVQKVSMGRTKRGSRRRKNR